MAAFLLLLRSLHLIIFVFWSLLGLWPWASAETLPHNISIIIQQHCLHTKSVKFLLLWSTVWGHIIQWGEETIPVLASSQVFSSFSFNVGVSVVEFQSVLILFCPWPWRCKMGRESSGLVTPYINKGLYLVSYLLAVALVSWLVQVPFSFCFLLPFHCLFLLPSCSPLV